MSLKVSKKIFLTNLFRWIILLPALQNSIRGCLVIKKGSFGIVCFGRGIERNSRGIWQPTAYLEKMTPDGQHSGYLTENLRLDSDDERVVIAGAYANVMAIAQLFRYSIHDEAVIPPLIAWAAGRPRYLENEPPDISEGSVLFSAFKEKIGDAYARHLPLVRLQFQTQNRNTRDDILQSLATAYEMKLKRLIIISVLVHLERISVFLEYANKEVPGFAKIDIELVASDLLLTATPPLALGGPKEVIGLDDPTISELNHLAIAKIIESPVYRRTAVREAKGITDLHAGRYDFGKQGYQFAAK